ncbi:MAG: hypothetical protein RLZZ505_2260 [Verrucomicrobiota bacterium]|jgi:hypothetical protein
MSGKTTRRRFLAGTAATLAGAAFLPAQSRRTKRVIHLFMEGGMSHLDTFDPKPGVHSIPTNVEGIRIGAHLPLIARRMDKITLIRSMSHDQRSHGAARELFPFPPDIIIGGWDTHTDNESRITKPCAELDHTLSGLLDDLETRGTLSDTILVVTTEFGRSAKRNAFGGREHHPAAFTCLLAGGGFGGKVIGQTSSDGMEVIGGKTSLADLSAGILTAWDSGNHSLASAASSSLISGLFHVSV